MQPAGLPIIEWFSGNLLLPYRCVYVAASIAPCFQGQYLVVVTTKALATPVSPIVDVVGHGDFLVGPGWRAAPGIFILPESGCTDNGRCIDPLAFVTTVGMPIAAYGAERRTTRHGALLCNVVFDERAGGPSIDADKVIAATEGADIVAYGPGRPGAPAFTADHIGDVAVADGEVTPRAMGDAG